MAQEIWRRGGNLHHNTVIDCNDSKAPKAATESGGNADANQGRGLALNRNNEERDTAGRAPGAPAWDGDLAALSPAGLDCTIVG